MKEYSRYGWNNGRRMDPYKLGRINTEALGFLLPLSPRVLLSVDRSVKDPDTLSLLNDVVFSVEV